MSTSDKELKKIVAELSIVPESIHIEDGKLVATVGYLVEEYDEKGNAVGYKDHPCGHNTTSRDIELKGLSKSIKGKAQLIRLDMKSYEWCVSSLVEMIIVFVLYSYFKKACLSESELVAAASAADIVNDEYDATYHCEKNIFANIREVLREASIGNKWVFQFKCIELPLFESIAKKKVQELLGDQNDVFCPSLTTDLLINISEAMCVA